jgi:hypothetical protein
MKNPIPAPAHGLLRPVFMFLALVFAMPAARAGLTFELDLREQSQGQSFYFVSPLNTNGAPPAAPLGGYFIASPHWPTNGSSGQFQLTTNGMSPGDFGEFGYGDFASVLQQITNGTWSILFTNATTTNLYTFTVSAPGVTSNTVPATVAIFPADASVILSGQTTFTWQGPTNWPVNGSLQTFNNNFYQAANPPASQTSWAVPGPIPVGTGYTFNLDYITNCVIPFFTATTPLSTNNFQPISGWASSNVLETSSSVGYDVVSTHGIPSQGHTLLADYTFEDNNLFAHDFSGNDNNMASYSWFSVPPVIVTTDAAAGTYAAGFGGSGWFNPPTNLLTTLAGSFSVSLWLKTTNVFGSNLADQYAAAGIVSALGGNYNNAVMPMGQTGTKLAFYTGGTLQNILRSQANINTGQYIHLVTTRDQQTGEKRIYINGTLDSSVFSYGDFLNGSTNELDIGYNNGNVFSGQMDEIQFYSGVLSSSDVAFLHSHPGTNVADTLELGVPEMRFDFEDTNNPGTDSSGHNNNSDCDGVYNSQPDTASTNAAVGNYSRQFFGDSYICFSPGQQCFASLSNAYYGSFSLSAWVNTTNAVNQDFANAYFGAPILFEYTDPTNQAVFSITGSKAAFTVGNFNGGQDTTLHSITSVNDGKYHLLVATRNQTNGVMNLYVDGNLEATGTSTNGPRIMTATAQLAGGYYTGYTGLLDDVRVYSGELSSNDVSALSEVLFGQLGIALDSPNLPWTTTGNTTWFVETTNTYDGVSAAQSGVLTDDTQYSSVQTTVTGPGILTFWWDASYDDDFDLEFDIDGGYGIYTDDDDYSSYGWTQDTFTIPAGTHTLSWFGYDADSTNDVGWLDQVVFTPATGVSIVSPHSAGGNFQFSFLTQNGFTHAVQYNTNLLSGDWQTYSYINGDGTVQNVQIPMTIFSGAKQGYVRVTTQ